MTINFQFEIPTAITDKVLADFFETISTTRTTNNILFRDGIRCDTDAKTQLLTDCLRALAEQIKADKALGV